MSSFVTDKEYGEAQVIVEAYEHRQYRIEQFKKELGSRLKDFIKSTFRIKDNRIIFSGYFLDKASNDFLVVGVTECSDSDIYDKVLGKLIAVRKALGIRVDDIIEVIEPKPVDKSSVGSYSVISLTNLQQQLAQFGQFGQFDYFNQYKI